MHCYVPLSNKSCSHNLLMMSLITLIYTAMVKHQLTCNIRSKLNKNTLAVKKCKANKKQHCKWSQATKSFDTYVGKAKKL